MTAQPRLVCLGLLWLVATAPGVLAAQAERALTLSEAIALALEKNEAIVVVRESVAAADGAITAAEGAYDPLLGLTADWDRAAPPVNSAFSGAPAGALAPTSEVTAAEASVDQLLGTGGLLSLRASASSQETDGSFALLSPSRWTQLGILFEQPLLRGRSVDSARLALRVAAADRAGAGAALRREVTDTVAAVEQAYWRLAAVQRAVEVGEEAVRLAEEQLHETQERIEAGTAPEKEIAQPRAELGRRRGNLIAAREALSRAGNALKLLILSDADADLWAARLESAEAVETAIVPVNAAAAMERALEVRPELEAVEAVVQRRRAETVFARNGALPSLDLVASYDRYGLAGSRNPAGASIPGLPVQVPPAMTGGWGQSLEVLADGDFDDARIALVLGVPIGNRAARGAVVGAESAERQAVAEVARTRKTIRAEVLDAAAAVDTAGQRIEAAKAARDAALVQLEAERERYAAGLSTNFLVLTRQNDLSAARLDEIRALADYRIAYAELARASGSLLEERGITAAEPQVEDVK